VRVIKIQTKGDVRISYAIETIRINEWTKAIAEVIFEKDGVPEWEIEAVSRMSSDYVGSLGSEFEILDVSIDRRTNSYKIKGKYEGFYLAGTPIEAIEKDIVESVLSLRFESLDVYEVNIEDPFEDYDPSEYWELMDWEE